MTRSKMGSCSNVFNNHDDENINKWRNYFREINNKINNNKSNIFEVIEQAIKVAALDCPKEFILQRVKIVELLFSCRLSNHSNSCLGCDSVELAGSRVSHHHVVNNDGYNNNNNEEDSDGVRGSCERGYSLMQNNKEGSNIHFSYGDAEALTDEIEQGREIVGEVLRIKEILHNHHDESDSVLYESLRRLQLMALTVDILKETEIGKAVNAIKRHGSKQNRHLARSLIDGWKVIVDEWMKATQEISEGGTPDSVNPSTLDEEQGLPSPPLDEAAFFATQDMELFQENFFDGIDDNGNPRNCGELSKNREVKRKPIVVYQDGPRRREERPKEGNPITRENKVQQMPNRASNLQSGPGRPLKVNDEMKAINNNATQHRPTKPVIKTRPASKPERLRLRSSDEVINESKIEKRKRTLENSYQQAKLEKKSRTAKVIGIHDLPKQGVVKKNTQGTFGNYNCN